MRAERVVVAATVVMIVGVAVVSGPLFGFSLPGSESAQAGTGSVDATVEEPPERGVLEPKEYGGEGYGLRGEPVLVSLEAVSGRPYLSYSLSVPGLNHSTTSLTVFQEPGQYRLEMRPSTLPSDRVDADSYEGTVSVHVIDGDGRRLLLETEVTVEVQE
jgi:hypothetical protein